MAQNVFLNIKYNATYAIYLDESLTCSMWVLNRGINITKVFATHIKLELIHGIKLCTFVKAMVYASLWQCSEISTI